MKDERTSRIADNRLRTGTRLSVRIQEKGLEVVLGRGAWGTGTLTPLA
jgi:hypothetical protein